MALKIKLKKGLLHKKLDVDKDKDIPQAKLTKALDSKSAKERKEAQFAKNAKQFKHNK